MVRQSLLAISRFLESKRCGVARGEVARRGDEERWRGEVMRRGDEER